MILRGRHMVAGAVAAALAVTGGMCVCPDRAVPGDMNGDSRIDILDLQGIVICVLSSGNRNCSGDINRDGKINILDFQRMVDEASQTPERPRKNSAPRHWHAVVSKHAGEAERWLSARSSDINESLSCSRIHCLTGIDLGHFSFETQRYFFTLTPHAPPFSC